jgi:hypothetical protein
MTRMEMWMPGIGIRMKSVRIKDDKDADRDDNNRYKDKK